MSERRGILMNKIIVTLLVATAGGLIGVKLKIPAGAMICSMFSVAIYNIFFAEGYIPSNFKIAAQIVVGGMIGLRFTKDTIMELKTILAPATVTLIGLTAFCVLLGYLLHKFTGMDLTTALFSTSPGGLTDMSLLADSYGADSPKVVVMHTMRLVTVVTIVPLIIKYLIKLTNSQI